jgi:hypothetical protein
MEKAEPVARSVVWTRHGPVNTLVRDGEGKCSWRGGRRTHQGIPRGCERSSDDSSCVDTACVWEGVEHGVAC